jgi:hypothetical protein
MTQLDGIYRTQRLRLLSTVAAAAGRAFGQFHGNKDEAIAAVVPFILAGQKTQVALTDAYMAAKTRAATGSGTVKGLDPNNYTVAELRGIPAEIVYERPYGAIGAQLKQGAEFSAALLSAQEYLTKTVATDLQLAQTHSARDWMVGDERIVGYRRSGGQCELCQAASDRTYYSDDLMPIHEHCMCGVDPVYGNEPVASVGTTVEVQDDPELGPRLMAKSWSSQGPRITPRETVPERNRGKTVKSNAQRTAR